MRCGLLVRWVIITDNWTMVLLMYWWTPDNLTTYCRWTSLYLLKIANWLPSVLWRCWLGGRKGMRPVKTEWWDAGVVMCLGQGADLHMAQLMPLPLTISCSSKSRLVLPSWWYLLAFAHPDKIQEGHILLVTHTHTLCILLVMVYICTIRK